MNSQQLKEKLGVDSLVGADLNLANLRSADLRSADLRGAYLRSANLRSADLRGAHLYGAHLRGANLYGADLQDADLYGANLYGADLRGAHLYGADLHGANLYGANLYGANLRNANLPYFQIPQGELIVYKKAEDRVVTLRVPQHAKRTASLIGRKCRCDLAEVLAVEGGSPVRSSIRAEFTKIIYTPGETVVSPNGYDDDPRVECARGIHFYLTDEEARNA